MGTRAIFRTPGVFLEGSGDVRIAGQWREELYAWTERTLVAISPRAAKSLP